MSGREEDSRWNELLQLLWENHLQLSQSAFDAINGHDKVLNLLRESLADIEELFGSLDIINMEFTGALADTDLPEERKQELFRMNDDIAVIADRLLRSLQAVLQEAEIGSVAIHKMEEDISNAQDAIEDVRNYSE